MSGGIAGRWTTFAARDHLSPRDVPFWPLLPLGWLHRGLVTLRPSPQGVRLPRPVISVGNLTVGGTGKSPATLLIAGMLRDAGLSPVILSRGYRRRGRRTVVVCDGQGPLVHPETGGDEPVMMARVLPQVPVYVDADRRRGAAAALVKHPEAVFLLDDGFSHRRLARDLDIVVLDATRPFGNGALLPAGLLREPKTALSRAGCVILNRAGGVTDDDRDRLAAEVASLAGGATVLTADYRALGILSVRGGGPMEVEGVPVLSFAGIVNQEHFVRTLGTTGVRSLGHVPFPDHHRYREADLRRLAERARTAGARLLVTTAKDAVKIDAEWAGSFPLARLEVRMEVSGSEVLRDLLLRAAGRG